jgi:hypothetical protein
MDGGMDGGMLLPVCVELELSGCVCVLNPNERLEETPIKNKPQKHQQERLMSGSSIASQCKELKQAGLARYKQKLLL